MRLPTSPKAPSPAERSAVVSAPSHRLTPSPHRPFRPAYCLLLGLALIPLNAFWLVRMEVAGMYGGAGGTTGPYPTSFSLYANAVVWLLLLVGANRLLLRRVPRLALDHALREAAVQAGAVPVRARITGVEAGPDGRTDALLASDGQRLAGDVISAADGALTGGCAGGAE